MNQDKNKNQGQKFDPNVAKFAKEFEGIAADVINLGINEKAVDFASKFAQFLTQGGDRIALTTSQIRNYFGEVRRIQLKGFENNKSAFYLLKPKLAYAAARADKQARIHEFRKVMDLVHEHVKNVQQYHNYCDFLEAILAYHKSFGGK
ncbi:MAG: type III-A CRISPR-associated protein Csm2 [Bacteroidia bacterium]|nr:type III-A CRISPR-associated protein Csm2 [Bacteroidia bacterium]